MHTRALLNLFASLFIKGFGVLYSVIIIGVAARHLSMRDAGNLILGIGFIAPAGIIQAGTSSYVLRSVIEQHVNTSSYKGVHEIGMSLRISLFFLFPALFFCLSMSSKAGLNFLGPTILIALLGAMCSVADQMWIGTERAWVTNICLFFAFLIFGIMFVAMMHIGKFDLMLISLITYGASGMSSIFSFAVALREATFRENLAPVSIGGVFKFVRVGMPMLMVSLGSVALIILPTIATVWPSFPRLSNEEIPLLRLCTISANAGVAILTPLLPSLIASVSNASRANRVLVSRYLPYFSIAFILSVAVVAKIILPFFILKWVGVDIGGLSNISSWSIVFGLYIGAGIFGQIALLTCRPLSVAFVVSFCDLLILSVMVVISRGANFDVSNAMILGLIFHVVSSVALIMRFIKYGPNLAR